MAPMRRLWKPLLVVGAVVTAFTVTFVWPRRNGLDLDIDSSPRARAARDRAPYDLTELKVLGRALLEIKDHYVDPERIDPRRMLLSGLDAIQRRVAPVIVHYEKGQPSCELQVRQHRQRFQVEDVDSPWTLAERFRAIFGFLQEHLDDEDLELREVEYAAVNGMLHTLDPHSVLLSPEVYEEMQTSTRGEFGGLGIVISIRDGYLTVIRPMENTPASRAGLQRGDRIVKIEEESTLNMPLDEAVDRLRGPPGTPVTVWIRRKRGSRWSKPRSVRIVRDVIFIDPVRHRMLSGGVGYVRILGFQQNTHEELLRALRALHQQGLRALVLDLRGNPGGLLEQAVRVADTFLQSGVIVGTQSRDPAQREEKRARREGTEPDYPMVVLVNGGSASASEIVAGALKNHDRALIVGQRSFGKGSVQVLYPFEDGSALKLTIAQYVMPGGISIQGVGVVPDVAIDPMTVDRLELDLAPDKEYLREADLSRHLTHARAEEQSEPQELLRYFLSKEEREKLRETDPEDPQADNLAEIEFLTRFSRRLLTAVRSSDRLEMLREARDVLARVRSEETAKAARALGELGVDWREGADEGPTSFQVEASLSPGERIEAGHDLSLRVTVRNTGSAPVYRLRAQIKSDYGLFDGKELAFGYLPPGASKSWEVPLGACAKEQGERRVRCRIPEGALDRADGLRVLFEEAHGHVPEPVEVRTRIEALPRPQFAFELQFADDVRGDGDGVVEPGERASLYVRVRNQGEGKALDAQANLRNLSGRGVLLVDGRFDLDEIPAGEERLVRFTFEVLPSFQPEQARFEVFLSDLKLGEEVAEKIAVPVERNEQSPSPHHRAVYLPEGALLRVRPHSEAKVAGRVEGGWVRVQAEAFLDDFLRIHLEDGRPAWVAKRSLMEGTERPRGPRGRVRRPLDHAAPSIEVSFDDLVTRSDHIVVRGVARDEQQVRDLYIFVGARKVFYEANDERADRRTLRFEARLPLRPGINYVGLFARERDDIVSRQTFVVRRDGPEGELLERPEHEEDDPFGQPDLPH